MWDWIRRMSNAIRQGWTAGVQAYKEDDYVPLTDFHYDDYKVRLARYWHYRLYADNTIFSSIQKYVESQKKQHKLYRHIRSIYNPVSRLIDLEVSKVYGGNLDFANDFSGGAIPIDGATPALIEAIKQLFIWSNMGRMKNRVVRDGATYGDAAYKVVDDRESQKVRLEVLDPRKIAEIKLDGVGNVKYVRIEYLKYDEATKKDYLYTEIIDEESFKFFRDEKPFAYFENGEGQLVDGWNNEYGFVPVRLAPHKEASGDVTFAATSFKTSLSKIDEMNDLASTIHDAIRKNMAPPWAASGKFQTLPTGSAKPKVPTEERDEMGVIKFPEGTTFTPLVLPIDVPGSIATLDKLIGEVEKDMPQLAIQRIRERSGDVSGVAVRQLYTDASDRIIETQGNYDAATVAAIQMAVTIGGIGRYRGFEAFDINSYDAGDLDFTIKERPVFPDEVDKQTKLNLVLQAADSPAMRLVLSDLGYSDEQIDQVEEAASGREAAAVRGLANAAFGEDDQTDEDNPDDTTEDGTDGEEASTQAPAFANA